MKAAEVMTPKVDATVHEAACMMLDLGISGLPVVDGAGRLIGIVIEGDFLRRTEMGTERGRPSWLVSEYVRSHGRKIEEIMTPNVISVSADTPLQDIVRIMERRRIKRVPVVRDGIVVGIISRANLAQALARVVEEVPPSCPDDGAIRAQIISELEKQQAWLPRSSMNVIVRKGIAELWGPS